MTCEAVVAAVRRLPVPEQLRMIEEVSRSVRETLAAPAPTDDEAQLPVYSPTDFLTLLPT